MNVRRQRRGASGKEEPRALRCSALSSRRAPEHGNGGLEVLAERTHRSSFNRGSIALIVDTCSVLLVWGHPSIHPSTWTTSRRSSLSLSSPTTRPTAAKDALVARRGPDEAEVVERPLAHSLAAALGTSVEPGSRLALGARGEGGVFESYRGRKASAPGTRRSVASLRASFDRFEELKHPPIAKARPEVCDGIARQIRGRRARLVARGES